MRRSDRLAPTTAVLAWLLPVALGAGDGSPGPVRNPSPLPRIWTSYRVVESPDADFADLRAHGVEVADVGRHVAPALLEAARAHGLKLVVRVSDGVDTGDLAPDSPERAVMMGGAYQGRAIDRSRFRFTGAPQEIVIERPIYHRDDVYGDRGHYHIGLDQPAWAEVVVKQADYDGRQHLRRLPATLERRDDNHWTMRFDLTGVEGDLDHVILAAYWRAQGAMHRARDLSSMRSAHARRGIERSTRETVERWRGANGGTFPDDVVIAVRFGDENFHTSSHVSTSPAVSAPMWDYSPPAVAAYRQRSPADDVPAGKPWIDTFGRRAYAHWLASYHESAALLARTVKETLADEGLAHLKVFRNVTRADVFSHMNDQDGTGLERLVRELDLVHLDPYPVRRGEYGNEIPVDMSYLAGLARRYAKPLVPWLQAHQYFPEGYFGLVHPSPEQIRRMVSEHVAHAPAALIWLGYGPGDFYTFPTMRPDSWASVKEVHARFAASEPGKIQPRFAAVRPYTVRALRDEDRHAPQDHFFTGSVLRHAVLERRWPYDPFEPLDTADLDPEELATYPVVLAEVGSLAASSLVPFSRSGVPCVLFVEGADRFDVDGEATGISRFARSVAKPGLTMAAGEDAFVVEAADLYELDPGTEVLARVDGLPAAWRRGNLLFVSARAAEGSTELPEWLWTSLLKTQLPPAAVSLARAAGRRPVAVLGVE